MPETLYQLQNPYIFGAMLVRQGVVDGQVHGIARSYPNAIRPVLQVILRRLGLSVVAGLYVMLFKNRTLLFADTKAVGPLLMGLSKPFNVLQRNTDMESVVNVITVTVVQARYLDFSKAPV